MTQLLLRRNQPPLVRLNARSIVGGKVSVGPIVIIDSGFHDLFASLRERKRGHLDGSFELLINLPGPFSKLSIPSH